MVCVVWARLGRRAGLGRVGHAALGYPGLAGLGWAELGKAKRGWAVRAGPSFWKGSAGGIPRFRRAELAILVKKSTFAVSVVASRFLITL